MNWIEVNLTVSNSGRSRTVSKRAERIHFGSTSGTLRPPGQPGWCSPVALQRSNPALYQSKTTREKLKIPPDHTHTPDPVMNRLRMRPTSVVEGGRLPDIPSATQTGAPTPPTPLPPTTILTHLSAQKGTRDIINPCVFQHGCMLSPRARWGTAL